MCKNITFYVNKRGNLNKKDSLSEGSFFSHIYSEDALSNGDRTLVVNTLNCGYLRAFQKNIHILPRHSKFGHICIVIPRLTVHFLLSLLF